MKKLQKYAAFTLIELIIFIVVIGIVGTSILVALNSVLRGEHVPSRQVIATQTATKCADWYLGQRQLHGFNTAALTCPSTAVPGFCAAPSGYIITTNVACTTLYGEANANYKTINIVVSGAGNASISLLLADYLN